MSYFYHKRLRNLSNQLEALPALPDYDQENSNKKSSDAQIANIKTRFQMARQNNPLKLHNGQEEVIQCLKSEIEFSQAELNDRLFPGC